jgi:hypothetical protein
MWRFQKKILCSEQFSGTLTSLFCKDCLNLNFSTSKKYKNRAFILACHPQTLHLSSFSTEAPRLTSFPSFLYNAIVISVFLAAAQSSPIPNNESNTLEGSGSTDSYGSTDSDIDIEAQEPLEPQGTEVIEGNVRMNKKNLAKGLILGAVTLASIAGVVQNAGVVVPESKLPSSLLTKFWPNSKPKPRDMDVEVFSSIKLTLLLASRSCYAKGSVCFQLPRQ